MRITGMMNVTTPTDREIAMTRVFDASHAALSSTRGRGRICSSAGYMGRRSGDWRFARSILSVGGALRFVWRHHDEKDLGMSGVYREIAPLERLVCTEVWDADWTGGEALVTIVFAEHAGKTTHAHADGALLLSHRPDAVRKTPKEHGVTQIYNRLAELLALKKEQEN